MSKLANLRATSFTEPGANGALGQVGKVTTSGVFTEYGIPSRGSFPRGIAVGSDGKLWFTEPGEQTNRIASVTISGASADYAMPTSGSVPHGIALGPDGNIWFTERSANKVAKIVVTS